MELKHSNFLIHIQNGFKPLGTFLLHTLKKPTSTVHWLLVYFINTIILSLHLFSFTTCVKAIISSAAHKHTSHIFQQIHIQNLCENSIISDYVKCYCIFLFFRLFFRLILLHVLVLKLEWYAMESSMLPLHSLCGIFIFICFYFLFLNTVLFFFKGSYCVDIRLKRQKKTSNTI